MEVTIPRPGDNMFRLLAIVSLLMLVGCADQSRGAALGECRMMYYLESSTAQGELVPNCMRAKSFQMDAACSPGADEHEWDWQVKTFAFDNPKCYRPIGSATWIATLLSPM
jgi:hypothetical protein